MNYRIRHAYRCAGVIALVPFCVLLGARDAHAEMLLTTIDVSYDSGPRSTFENGMRAVLKRSDARRIFGFGERPLEEPVRFDWRTPRDIFTRSNEGMRIGRELDINRQLILFASTGGTGMIPFMGWLVDSAPSTCDTGFTCAIDSEIAPGPSLDLFGSGYHASYLELTYHSWEHIEESEGIRTTRAEFTLQLFGGLGEVPEPSSWSLLVLASLAIIRVRSSKSCYSLR